MEEKGNHIKLWENVLKGELDALAQVYAIYYDDLYFYALKLTEQPDLAEDAVQDVFVDLWNYRQKIGSIHSPKFYLIRSVRNQCLKLLKKQNRYLNLTSADALDLTITPADLLLNTDNQNIKNAIQQAMKKLSPRQKEIIYLKFYNNLDYEELAAVLEINYQSVVNHIHKAMIKLRHADVLKHFK